MGVAHRPFLQQMTHAASSGQPAFSWSAELLPLQWKIGVQSVAAYFLWKAYTPIVSVYHGVETGAQMGMTMQAIATIQMLALAWIQTRVPRIGSLLAASKRDEARGLFRWMFLSCMAVYIAGSLAFLLLVLVLRRLSLGSRARTCRRLRSSCLASPSPLPLLPPSPSAVAVNALHNTALQRVSFCPRWASTVCSADAALPSQIRAVEDVLAAW